MIRLPVNTQSCILKVALTEVLRKLPTLKNLLPQSPDSHTVDHKRDKEL